MSYTQSKVTVKATPKGLPTVDDFEIATVTLADSLEENQAYVKSLYVSTDPYIRGTLRYAPIGSTVSGSSVVEVVESKNAKFAVGDKFVLRKGWVSHAIVTEETLNSSRKIDPSIPIPASTALGVLGMPGATAYLGLIEICNPQKGEVAVVSGAAGAVGSIVGQIAKLLGLTVIGFAGTDEKCEYIKTLGFDHAINYKTAGDLKQALAKVAPDGIDVFFDNTGGPIQDAVFGSLKKFARISVCGQISTYNQTVENPAVGPRLLGNLIYKSAKVQGFVVSDWIGEKWAKAIIQLATWIGEGKISYRETVAEAGEEGMKAVPKAFISMMTGGNIGKQLVKL